MSTTAIVQHHYRHLEDHLRAMPMPPGVSSIDASLDEISVQIGRALQSQLTASRHLPQLAQLAFDGGIAVREGRVVLGNGRRFKQALQSFLQTLVYLTGFETTSGASTTSMLITMTTRLFKGRDQGSGRSIIRRELRRVLDEYGQTTHCPEELLAELQFRAELTLRDLVLNNLNVRRLMVRRAQTLGLICRQPGMTEAEFVELLMRWMSKALRLIGIAGDYLPGQVSGIRTGTR